MASDSVCMSLTLKILTQRSYLYDFTCIQNVTIIIILNMYIDTVPNPNVHNPIIGCLDPKVHT